MTKVVTRYPNFDLLRLLLALEVVALHTWSGMQLPDMIRVPVHPVAAFIALSGFLIPQSLERSRSIGHFAWKRVLRTTPGLTVLLIAIAFTFGVRYSWIAIKQYVLAGYGEQFFNTVLPLWSLGVEDALYILMVAGSLIGVYRRPILVWLLLFVLLALFQHVTEFSIRYRFLDTSISFLIGNLIYLYVDRLSKVHWIIPMIAFLFAYMRWIPSPFCLPISVGAALLFAMRARQIKLQIPDLSYGIYIWHGPIGIALINLTSIGRDMEFAVMRLLLTAAIATLSWYLIEKPALQFKDWKPLGLLGKRRTLPAAVVDVKNVVGVVVD
jgi:peptidoglycan/LPS O-acetylase OafA/YrhL